MSVQLAISFSKYLFSKAKITRFEKTSFKLTATEVVKIKLHYDISTFEFRGKPNFDFFQNFRLSPTLMLEMGGGRTYSVFKGHWVTSLWLNKWHRSFSITNLPHIFK